jgi:hypothetical protein
MHIMLSKTHASTQASASKAPRHVQRGWTVAVQTLLSAGLVLQTGIALADYKGANPMQESRDVAAAMLKELGQKLQAAMAEGGALNAIGVCHTQAPAIAARISAEENITITRIGTRVRNPVLGVPNDWQALALKEFEDGLAKGQKPADMEFVQAVKAGAGSRMELRYAKPIVTQPMCLSCHGSGDDISQQVKAKLDELYPNDKANGYKVGELRGAVVVTRFIGYSNN